MDFGGKTSNDAVITADGMIANAEGIAHIYIESEQTKQVELGKYSSSMTN